MAPVEVTDDYYAILEVSQTANATDIKKVYHRLAILRHPDKNQNKSDATASFQLLNRAYETLKDDTSRRIYDIRWPQITKTYRTAQEKAKREEEAAKAESEKSAKTKAAREAEERRCKATIESLVKQKNAFMSEIFEVKRMITRLQFELKNIQIQEDKALQEERARNSWSTYVYSSVFHTPEVSEQTKQERDLQRLQRVASRTIKEKDLSRKEAKLKEWNSLLFGVEREIATELSSRREREMQAEKEKEKIRRQEEAKAWKKQHEEFLKRERAHREATEAREAQERASAEAFRRAAEERQKKVEEERRKTEAVNAELLRKCMERRERERVARQKKEVKEEEERRKNVAGSSARSQRSNATRTTASSSASCQHRGWWERIDGGRLVCESCNNTQRRFLFQCPQCQLKACADCRTFLKNNGGNARDSFRNRAPGPQSDSYQYEESFDNNWYD